MKVDIRPATLRDLCFIAAHMRPEDKEEIYCQFEDGTPSTHIAVFCQQMSGEYQWCAWLDGSPVGAFGMSHFTASSMMAWAFGTKKFKRVVPAISRFVITDVTPKVIRSSLTRIEIRALATHDIAHKWLSALGARKDCDLHSFGKNGEDFVLYSWSRKEVKDVLRRQKQIAARAATRGAEAGRRRDSATPAGRGRSEPAPVGA
ncbi:MAG: hypothetical protein QNJ62_06240 [Methyloceanibacter sp.]|nr:hypothetical protein [Methyloceanibacter sp.]